jgi:hypothetical protein
VLAVASDGLFAFVELSCFCFWELCISFFNQSPFLHIFRGPCIIHLILISCFIQNFKTPHRYLRSPVVELEIQDLEQFAGTV